MLSAEVERFVELRRALGLKFRVQGLLLRSFAAFAEARGDPVVRVTTAIAWAAQASSNAQRRNRLLTVRRFARELHAEDPQHEVPHADALGRARFARRQPYIYEPEEVAALIHAAAQLSPAGSLPPVTYATLFALMVTTGLRSCEALSLRLEDVHDDGLLIRATKFRKSRLVPLHDSARRAMERYIGHRLRPSLTEGHVFVGLTGKRLSYTPTLSAFRSAADACDLHRTAVQISPRLHDLRHTFAVRALERSATSSRGIERHILALR